MKSNIKTINMKYQLQRRKMDHILDHTMDHILYQIFKYITKKREILTCDPPIRIYVNQIENKITFRIKIRILS